MGLSISKLLSGLFGKKEMRAYPRLSHLPLAGRPALARLASPRPRETRAPPPLALQPFPPSEKHAAAPPGPRRPPLIARPSRARPVGLRATSGRPACAG